MTCTPHVPFTKTQESINRQKEGNKKSSQGTRRYWNYIIVRIQKSRWLMDYFLERGVREAVYFPVVNFHAMGY